MSIPNSTKLDFAQDLDFDQILTNPILDISARFWEDDRYEAFRVCYRSMRVIDDLVDHRKSGESPHAQHSIGVLESMIDDWLLALRKRDAADPFMEQLLAMIERYSIPVWPWERLAKAMKYDLRNDGFETLMAFRKYCEGAAIAPATIFMHLCGLVQSGTSFKTPGFDACKAARPLALFSYFVHIIRDFQKDQRAGLQYLADDVVAAHGLDRPQLREIARTNRLNQPIRDLIGQYGNWADFYRQRSLRMLEEILPQLEPRYQLSLTMIYELYCQIFERIVPHEPDFALDRLQPIPEQVRARIDHTIAGFSPRP